MKYGREEVMGMGQYLRPFIIFLLLLFIAVACDGTNGNNTTTRTIGPEGGTIRSSDGRLTLIIPAGALTEDTEITIRKINPEDLGPDFGGIFPDFAYQLEPDGLEFGETVTASLELEDEPTNGDGDFVSDVVVLLSLSGETLEFLENQEQILDGDNNTNTISAELTHFSELLSFTFDGFKFSVEGVPDSLPPNSDFTAVLKVSFTEEVSPFISGTEMNFRDQSKSPVMPSSFFFLPLAFAYQLGVKRMSIR